MITMVCFTCAGEAYCIPVESTRGVRRAEGIRAVPWAGSDIAGVLPGEPALTVLSVLGAGRYVLIIDVAKLTFGLLVEAVTELWRIDEADILPVTTAAPAPLITGTVYTAGTLTFVADPHALAARL